MKFILLAYCIFFATSFTAQNSTVETSDQESLDIIKEITEKYNSYKNISVEFEMDLEMPGRGLDKQAGTFIQENDKFSIDLETQKIISDTETLWVYLKELNEVQINDADFEEDSDFLSPSSILDKINSNEFVSVLSAEFNEDGVPVRQLEFKPVDRDSEYSKMRLTINHDNSIKRLKVFSKDGNRVTMSIKKLVSNINLDKDFFVFNPSNYDNILIEDLRF